MSTFKHGSAKQNWNSRTLFSDKFFFPGINDPGLLKFNDRTLIQRTVLRRGNLSPCHPTADQLLTCVAKHVEESIIRLLNRAGKVSRYNAYDICVGKPSKARLAKLKVM